MHPGKIGKMLSENLFNGIFKNKNVLVTGHTGFQGSWLSLWLKLLGSNVVGYALEPPTQPSLFETLSLEHEAKHIIGDLRDKEKLSSIISQNQPEIIFHLGAQALVRRSYKEPLETLETNIIGTANLLESIRNCPSVKVVVIMTSDKCYDNTHSEHPHTENDPMGGFDLYSASKGAAELVTSSYRNSFFSNGNLTRIATVRAGNVIGGGDWAEDRLIPDSIRALMKNQSVGIRNPNAKRPWQYVLESISGMLWLAAKMFEEDKFNEAWNFGPDIISDSLQVEDIVKRTIKNWDSKSTIKMQNNSDILHESESLLLDSSKANQRLGWKNVYSIDQVLSETVEWYKTYHENNKDMKQFTISQIKNYISYGQQSNLAWAKQEN